MATAPSVDEVGVCVRAHGGERTRVRRLREVARRHARAAHKGIRLGSRRWGCDLARAHSTIHQSGESPIEPHHDDACGFDPQVGPLSDSNRIFRSGSIPDLKWTVQHAQGRRCIARSAARFALARRTGRPTCHTARASAYSTTPKCHFRPHTKSARNTTRARLFGKMSPTAQGALEITDATRRAVCVNYFSGSLSLAPSCRCSPVSRPRPTFGSTSTSHEA